MRSNKCVFTSLGASNHAQEERQSEDYYATDPKALELILPHITLHENVWECACGGGHLSEVLKRNGYKVYSTDLVDRGYQDRVIDFLKADKPFFGDILTNPPYKYAQEFVEHALELLHKGNKLIMFLKVLFLESKARKSCLKNIRQKKYGLAVAE